jgi:predicted protein tyrosine phosphatase
MADKIILTICPAIVVKGRSFDDDTAVISIVSPGVDFPEIHCKNLCRCQFYDVEREICMGDVYISPMAEWQAEQIVDFALQNVDKKYWIIHCEAGVGRSPAIALGLARKIRFDKTVRELETKYPCHNKHVRRLIEETIDLK